MNTGEAIRNRRKEVGISADALAAALGVARSTIFRYENGEIEKLPAQLIEPMASALNTTPAKLFGWEIQEGELPEEIHIINRAAKKMSAEDRQKLLDMARLMFREEFQDD